MEKLPVKNTIEQNIEIIKESIILLSNNVLNLNSQIAIMDKRMTAMEGDIRVVRDLCYENRDDINRLVRMFGEYAHRQDQRITALELKLA